MKFQVNRDVFSEAVSFAVKLLPQRTTLPILSGVLIQANDDGLVLSSFDYEVSSQTEIQADVEETGTVLVSGPTPRRDRRPAAERARPRRRPRSPASP